MPCVPEYILMFEGKLKGKLHEHEYETDDVAWFDVSNLPPMSRKLSMDEIQRYLNAALSGETIFDNEEVQSLINESQINANSTDAEKITISDVFQFLKNIILNFITLNNLFFDKFIKYCNFYIIIKFFCKLFFIESF